MNILITGVSGFIGHYLAKEALSLGHIVVGVGLWRDRDSRFLGPLLKMEGFEYLERDILDGAGMKAVVDDGQWDAVFHLAGQAVIPTSNDNPAGTYALNVLGTVNLLEALIPQAETLRLVQLSSSSDAYGDVREWEQPIGEDWPVRPDGPYGASKAAMELAGLSYRQRHGMPVVSTRLFTCAGPMQWEDLLVGFLARRCAEIALGMAEPRLGMGRLDNLRSFIDVRDTVRAYLSLLEKAVDTDTAPWFNVTGSEVWTIGQIVDEFRRIVKDRSDVDVEVWHDPARVRPKDKLKQVGNGLLLQGHTGFQPCVPFKQTLHDSFEYWWEELGRGTANSH